MKKSNNLSQKMILIIGAGHVGEACAFKFIQHGVKKIILHTLTEEEAILVFNRINPYAKGKTDIVKSWGNVLFPNSLAKKTSKQIIASSIYTQQLLKFNFDTLKDELLEDGFLFNLVKKYNPDVIVDTINTATVVGYEHDPYSLARKVLNNEIKNASLLLLSANPIAPLIRFAQSLKYVLDNLKIDSYIKVSTTGLGGMGINLPYTHGDLNEPGMSSGILGKVAAAGIMHQLFWSLSHTPKCNIKVVVPATLIGWQHVEYGNFRSHGSGLQKVEIPKKQKIKKGKITFQKHKILNETIKIPYVDSGENNAYSLHEMMTITSLGQMEAVTREEVAEAVLESIFGSTKYDILTALDNSTLNPSYAAAIQKTQVFDKIRKLEEKSEYPSLATNNLGPTVSKHIFELYVLLQIADNSIEKLLKMSFEKIINSLKTYLKENKEIIEYALALRIPIIDTDNNLWILDNAFVPENKKGVENISEIELEKYISSGWVDFRKKTVKMWLNKL